jgi:hypothetical protein
VSFLKIKMACAAHKVDWTELSIRMAQLLERRNNPYDPMCQIAKALLHHIREDPSVVGKHSRWRIQRGWFADEYALFCSLRAELQITNKIIITDNLIGFGELNGENEGPVE